MMSLLLTQMNYVQVIPLLRNVFKKSFLSCHGLPSPSPMSNPANIGMRYFPRLVCSWLLPRPQLSLILQAWFRNVKPIVFSICMELRLILLLMKEQHGFNMKTGKPKSIPPSLNSWPLLNVIISSTIIIRYTFCSNPHSISIL